MPLYDEVQAGH